MTTKELIESIDFITPELKESIKEWYEDNLDEEVDDDTKAGIIDYIIEIIRDWIWSN